MCSRVWQGSGVVVLSWLLLACSSSKTAAPVHSLGNDQVASTIPVRQRYDQARHCRQRVHRGQRRHSLFHCISFWHGCGFAYQHQWHHSPITFIPASSSGSMALPPMAVATVGSPVSRGSVTGSGSYEVRRGDTLSSIGRQFGLSNQALAQRNNLRLLMHCTWARCSMWGRGFLGWSDGGSNHTGCDQHGAQTPGHGSGRYDHTIYCSENDCSCLVNSIRSGERTKPSVPRQHSPGIGRPKGGSLKASPLRNKATRASTFPARRANPFTLRAAAKWSMRAVHCEVMAS